MLDEFATAARLPKDVDAPGWQDLEPDLVRKSPKLRFGDDDFHRQPHLHDSLAPAS
jgi:hypothetical protein